MKNSETNLVMDKTIEKGYFRFNFKPLFVLFCFFFFNFLFYVLRYFLASFGGVDARRFCCLPLSLPREHTTSHWGWAWTAGCRVLRDCVICMSESK